MDEYEWTDAKGTRWSTRLVAPRFLLQNSNREAEASEFQEKRAMRHELLRLAARVKELEKGREEWLKGERAWARMQRAEAEAADEGT